MDVLGIPAVAFLEVVRVELVVDGREEVGALVRQDAVVVEGLPAGTGDFFSVGVEMELAALGEAVMEVEGIGVGFIVDGRAVGMDGGVGVVGNHRAVEAVVEDGVEAAVFVGADAPAVFVDENPAVFVGSCGVDAVVGGADVGIDFAAYGGAGGSGGEVSRLVDGAGLPFGGGGEVSPRAVRFHAAVSESAHGCSFFVDETPEAVAPGPRRAAVEDAEVGQAEAVRDDFVPPEVERAVDVTYQDADVAVVIVVEDFVVPAWGDDGAARVLQTVFAVFRDDLIVCPLHLVSASDALCRPARFTVPAVGARRQLSWFRWRGTRRRLPCRRRKGRRA